MSPAATREAATPATTRARSVSIVIPNRNGAATIGACLRAALASRGGPFEVVVVDDASEDASVEIIRRFPCRLVRLDRRQGVSKARNAGARAASGELLLFVDADCLLAPDAVAAARAACGDRRDLVLGGTYTAAPADDDFFSFFQSVFIRHFETKGPAPDYVAAHALLVDAETFRGHGGFVEDAFIGVAASVEDVELSHRLRRGGCELAMCAALEVQHVFRFSLRRSLANAARKARYWTAYSLANGDLLADSGTASVELKANVALAAAQALLVALAAAAGSAWPAVAAATLLAADLHLNRALVAAWWRAGGPRFALLATLYYATLYAAAVGLGAAAGAAQWAWRLRFRGRVRSCTPRSDTYPLSS
ncbi:MAG TPA: glycosyltransferase [Anaeromyxobacter sp.]|nr:glycosyltransferase [Anaeromyxobacter sp.]